eukprot:SAG31_NODE_12950_length_905_cov_0.894541_2_plen_127_part_00
MTLPHHRVFMHVMPTVPAELARYTDQYKTKIDSSLSSAVELNATNFPSELLRPQRKRQRVHGSARLPSATSGGPSDSDDDKDKDGDEETTLADGFEDESDDNDYNMHGDVEAGGDSDYDFDETANE